jgi:hypothetical protein
MHTIEINALIEHMWQNYLQLNPNIRHIHQLLADANNGYLVNDHIALRTFNIDAVNIDSLARPFVKAGYRIGGRVPFCTEKALCEALSA